MNILITAGPTYEPIDPVRFIGNRSTGKMGFAIAQAAAEQGHNVTLIAGPVSLSVAHPRITRIDVETAAQMYEAAMAHFPKCDGAILTAAVADFTPIEVATKKIKRLNDDMIVRLRPTQDIAAALGACKTESQFLVGFALETDNELANALSKMQRKRFDLIVLNSLRDPGAGFQYDTNKITILNTLGEALHFDLKPKTEVALDILNALNQLPQCAK